MKKICSISIDVDSLDCYYQIHGISAGESNNAVYEKAIPRFLDVLEEFGIKATFFVVGKDVEQRGNRAVIRDIIQAGHEIGNHTWSHPYNLVRLPTDVIRREIEDAHSSLQDITGSPISGFRAPGYNINSDVMVTLKDLDYSYDSSIFPSAPYYLAKLTTILLKRIKGKKSRTVMGHPGVLLAPTRPYFASCNSPWFRERDGLVELPISVLPVIGLPFIGTFITLAGRRMTLLTYKTIKRLRDFLNLEFHAIDLLGLEEDGIDPALSCQVDLRVSYRDKLSLFKEVFSFIKEDDYEILTLKEVSQRMLPQADG
jgi:hypothetical protein